MYLEFKNDQRLGKAPQAGPKDGNGDSLSVLPNIIGGGNERNEKLLKRHSGGKPSRPSLAAEAIESFVKK